MKKHIHNCSFISKMIGCFLWLLFSLSLFGQQAGVASLINSLAAPINDDLCDAIPIALNTSCAGFLYTNVDGTTEGSEVGGCGADIYTTVWFSFEAPASGIVDVVTEPEFGEIMERYVFEEGPGYDCSDLSTLDVVDCNDDFGVLNILELTGLTPGDTYYVRIQTPAPPFSADFCIEFVSPIPPDNDDLCDATLLFFGDECSGFPYNNESATLQAGEFCCDCIGGQDKSVWFKFIAPSIGSDEMMSLFFENMDSDRLKIYLFEEGAGFDCSDLTTLDYIDCVRDDYGRLIFPAMTPGDTYYFSVGGYTAPYEEDFCVELKITPINDIMCNAIELIYEGGSNCYTNEGATIDPYWDEGPFGSYYSDCGDGILNTVWFYFEAPPSGTVIVETESLDGSIDIERMVLEMECCSIFEECDIYAAPDEFGCNNDDTASGGELFVSGLDPGDYYYVVIQTPFDEEGVEFCIEVKSAAPVNDDLCDAIELVADETCGLETYPYTNIFATTEVDEPLGCSSTLFQSVWFSFEAPGSGLVAIYLSDNSTGADYETHLFKEGAGFICSDLTTIDELECDYDFGGGGSNIEAGGLTPGDDYYIRIQFQNQKKDYFCIEIVEIIPPVNDELCNAITLTIDEDCVGDIYNNDNATIGIGPGEMEECAFETPNSVWFTFTAPPSGSVTIETSGQVFERAVYSEGIGFDCFSEPNLSIIDCNDDESVFQDLELCDLIPGDDYYLRLVCAVSFGEAENRSSSSFAGEGDYCVAIYDGPGPSITLDEAEIEICSGQTSSVELIYEETTNDPTLYSIDYDVDANADGLADIVDEPFPVGILELSMGNLDFTNSEITGSIVVKNASCEAPPVNFTIDVFQPASLAIISLSGPGMICNGEESALEVDITGGTPPYTITYSDGVDNFMKSDYFNGDGIGVMPTTTSNYILIDVVDSKGCTAGVIDGAAEVIVNDGPGNAELTGGGNICLGGSSTISFNIDAGQSPYYVEYFDGIGIVPVFNYINGAPINVSPLVTTEYTPIFVEDDNNCTGTVSGSATVTVFDPITNVTIQGGGEICAGESVTIWFDITGGTGPYEITYFDGLFFETVSNYFSGDFIEVFPFATTSYTPVSVEDVNSCGGPVNGMAEVIVNEGPNFANLVGGDAICEGESAIISFDILGGQSPYYVEYFDGVDTEAIEIYESGDPIIVAPEMTTVYTPFYVTDSNGCEASVLDGEVLITVYEYPGFATLEGGGEICNGASSTIWFDIPAGTPPYYVEYFDGMDFIGVANYMSGDPIIVSPMVTTDYFSSTVIDANGCYASIDAIVTVIVNDGPSLALINGTQAICPDATADIFVELTGGTSPFELVLYDGDSEFIIEDYLSGELITVSPNEDTEYTIIQITDANGCEAQVIDGIAEVIILEGPGICLLDREEEEICIGFSTNIFFVIESGNGPYTVTYTDGENDFIITDYENGDLIPVMPLENTYYYPISVIDNDGCVGNVEGFTAVFVLTGPEEVIVEGSGALCSGEDPSISINIDGGYSPYIITYTDGDDIFTEEDYDSGDKIYLEPEGVTDYTIISVTDDDGCIFEVNEVITLFFTENPGLATISGMASICPGEQAQIFVEVEDGSGPYSVLIYNGTENIPVDDYDSGDPISVDPQLTTNYSLISVFDVNGCEAEITGSALVEVSEGPGLVSAEGSQTICVGDDAEISFTISSGLAPFTVVYFDGLDEITLPDYMSGDPIILSPENTTNNIPISIVDANGCPGEFNQDITIEVLPRPDAVLLEGDFEICKGDEIELMIMINSGTGPFTIVYNNGMEDETDVIFNLGDPLVIMPEFSTTYTAISITDANGCSGTISGSASVIVEEVPTINLTDQYCSEDMTTYTLEFMTDGDMLISDIGSVVANGGGLFTVSDIPEGMSVTISATSMLASCLTEIIFNAPDCDCLNVDPPVSNGDQSICEGDSFPELSVTVNANETVDWYDAPSNGNLLLMGSVVYTPTMAGLFYAETRELDTDCVSLTRTALEFSINGLPSPTITGITEICSGQGSTILDAGNGYSSYLWSTGEDTQTIEVFAEGNYSVVVTDEFGCSGENDITVNEIDLPQVEITGLASICAGQATELGLGDSYESVLWSTGEDTNVIVVDELGEYSVMVTDVNGCTGEASVVVEEFDVPQVEITGVASICADQSTELGLGDSYESVLWNTGDNTEVITVQDIGEYSVTVTDINGCIGEASITVNEFDVEEISIIGDAVICEGAISNLSIDGSFEAYMWSTGDDTESISVSESGIYSLTVIDENGCASEAMFEVEVEDGLGFETKFLANKSVCVGDTVHLFDISEIDSAADEYLWDFGDGNSSIERDPVHTYTVPGSYNVQLIATVEGCFNKSIFKQIDVFDCRREIYDDSNFASINVAPNPSEGTFSLILEFITETDALIELYTVDGILLHSEFFSGKLIRKNYDLRETGVYFIKVKTPFYSKAKKVLVHK